MYPPEMGVRMSAAAASILREIYGQNARKKISRRFGVALDTAKDWLDGCFPVSRTDELAAVVREDLARREAQYAEILTQLGTENEKKRDR